MSKLSIMVGFTLAYLVPLYVDAYKKYGPDIAGYIVFNVLHVMIGFIVMIALWVAFVAMIESVHQL